MPQRRQNKKPRPAPPHTDSHEAILESISDGVFTVDADWRISSFNHAAEQITGVSRADALGQPCMDVFRSSMCGDDCALRKTLKTGRPVIGKAGYIVRANGERVPISVSTAVLKDSSGRVIGGAETFRDLSEIEALRRKIEDGYSAGELTSRSPLMNRIFEVLPAIASSRSTVLITGQTGTGKELFARSIHSLSPRAREPFVAVNCGAIPDSLLESELFGYKAGAFTGADRDKPGRFTAARGGTLFLDEIGEISPALQVKLLRVLQERSFEPLGSSRTEHADVRVIAATNRDLPALCRAGAFREDLYYRINVVNIEVPPLSRRKEDIPLLTEQFIAKFNLLDAKNISGICPDALALLMAHDWPGNVRELENAIERAFILCSGARIELAHLPEELTLQSPARKLRGGALSAARQTSERQSIMHALKKNRGNRSQTARELGIHKTTLMRKIARLEIPLPNQDGRQQGKKSA